MQRILTLAIPATLAVGMSALSAGAAEAGSFGNFFGNFYAPLQSRIEPVQDWRDCHNLTHNHYVPEWGVVAPHHHKGPYCTPIQDENDLPPHRSFRGDQGGNFFFNDRPRRYRYYDDYNG